MKISGVEKRNIEVEVREYDAVMALFDKWRDSINMKGSWIARGEWCGNDYYGSHSKSEVIREATEQEVEVFNSFEILRKVFI